MNGREVVCEDRVLVQFMVRLTACTVMCEDRVLVQFMVRLTASTYLRSL